MLSKLLHYRVILKQADMFHYFFIDSKLLIDKVFTLIIPFSANKVTLLNLC